MLIIGDTWTGHRAKLGLWFSKWNPEGSLAMQILRPRPAEPETLWEGPSGLG